MKLTLSKIALIVLAVFLTFSLLFNIYFMNELNRVNSMLEYYCLLMEKREITKENIGVAIISWKVYPQQRSGVYFISITFEVTNYGRASAFVLISVDILHEGKTIYEFFETGVGRGVFIPVQRYTGIIVPPGERRTGRLDFGFLNPENFDIYPYIYVVDVCPVD